MQSHRTVNIHIKQIGHDNSFESWRHCAGTLFFDGENSFALLPTVVASFLSRRLSRGIQSWVSEVFEMVNLKT